MCSQNLMGVAVKINVVAGAMVVSHILHSQEKQGCWETLRIRMKIVFRCMLYPHTAVYKILFKTCKTLLQTKTFPS